MRAGSFSLASRALKKIIGGDFFWATKKKFAPTSVCVGTERGTAFVRGGPGLVTDFFSELYG